MEKIVRLTLIDKIVLESYRSALDGLADYLGDGFEFVLHSLENLEQSVIKIINGHHTGREEGAPITGLALEMLSKIEESENSYITYQTKNIRGEPLKSSTILIRGENNYVIGLLCINFYMNTPLINVINSFIQHSELEQSLVRNENYATNADELLERETLYLKNQVDQDTSIPSSSKNKEIIQLLYQQGYFKFKDSVAKIADLLGISKNTVYLHLRQLQKQ